MLRRELYRSGFEIMEERAAADGERFYSVMLVRHTGVVAEPDELFCYCGKITDPLMLRHIAGKLEKNAAGMERSPADSSRAGELRALAGKITALAHEHE